MNTDGAFGWKRLIAGYPWFEGAGNYPLPAYSEFTPPPRLGRRPYGATDTLFSDNDPYGWHVSEIEQEYELNPGLENIARQIVGQLIELGRGMPAHHVAGHQRRNLENNPYWPADIAARAGQFDHERYVTLLPLALSRTQDDMGRVRWTFFGSSEQGPERAFWKSFYSAPGQELPERQATAFVANLLHAAYGESARDAAQLMQIGFRILPSPKNPTFPYFNDEPLPAWTRRFVVNGDSSFDDVNYLLTFAPFSSLPATVKQKYLDGKLHLLPFPGSLVFWGIPVYQRLQEQLPLALQLPLQRLVVRHDGPDGIRVPQSGWLHEPRRDQKETELQAELLLNSYRRTNRWNRVHRYEDGAARSNKVDKVMRILFSTSLDAMDLYDKPMARNCQLWRENGELLLDGPNASRKEIERAASELIEGGIFRYRFQFPPMCVGLHEVYWHRPLVAFLSHHSGQIELLDDAPPGYLTAYRSGGIDLAYPVELFPRQLRREIYLSALKHFETSHDHYAHQTALNIITLLDAWKALGEQPLARSFTHYMIRTAKEETLDDWLKRLSAHSAPGAETMRVHQTLESLLQPDQVLPDAITFGATATRAYEEAYWNDILTLSHGRYLNKDNADVVQDPPTLQHVEHQHSDLEPLGDYLIERHRQAIAAAGMEGKSVVGELPFRWQTDFDFPLFGGWKVNQEGHERERNLLVVIPGKKRNEAVVLADHYDTAYMEDIYEKSRGGSGARIAAPGADDNDSATATLLQAAPIFLRLASEGKLERDIWLLHLTGEEFPGDSLGARHFCQSLVERNLKLRVGDDQIVDLSSVRLVGVFVMDMIAHNRDNAQDIFQISAGKSRDSLRIAYQAHLANMIWNEKTREWNRSPERHRRERGRRCQDGVTLPDIAQHLELDGQVRTHDDPQSSLYNTDGQIFSDIGAPVVLFMENYDINRTGYHDTKDTMENIDLDYGAALSAIAIETVARVATLGGESGRL
ncbi:MAG: M28 family metallopeptidase [Bacteroidetes bacterium]|nr:M28 family metallopeptidase [Bacteroidota bacterium]